MLNLVVALDSADNSDDMEAEVTRVAVERALLAREERVGAEVAVVL